MDILEDHLASDYKYGFVTDIETDDLPPGLNEDIIRALSAKKNEPEWMTEWRLEAYQKWLSMTEPTHWPNFSYEPMDYQALSYYSAPKQKEKLGSLD
ncbi:MAG: Fe-S cluster assembly protein SufB, partial [Flavobacteriales bacterium]